ncbi:MAG: hypothetical protein ACON3Z_10055 [Bradymonadia bacterium]
MKLYSLILSVIAMLFLGACDDGSTTTDLSDANLPTDGRQDGGPSPDGTNATDGSAEVDSSAASDADSPDDGIDARLPTDGGIPDSSAADSNVDAGSADGAVEQPQSRLRLIATPPITALDVQGGRVSLRCEYVSADGNVLDAPEDLSYGFESPQATLVDGRWQFSEYGAYTANCASASLSLSSETDIITRFDGVDYRYADNLDALYEAAPLYRRLALAFTTGDAETVEVTLMTLRRIGERFADIENVEWIAPHPLQEWPENAELEADGLNASPDDDAWLAALENFDNLIEAHQGFWRDLDPDTLDNEQANAVRDDIDAMRRAASQISQLPVSAYTGWLERARIGDINRKLLMTGMLMHDRLIEYYSGPIPEPVENGFVGAGVLTTIVVQSALVAAEEAFEEVSYTRMLRDVALSAVASYVQLAARMILNLNFEAPENGIRVDSIHGPAGGFMGQGNPFYAIGNFPPPLEANSLIIIPPRYSLFIENIVDALESLESIWDSPKIVMKAQEVQRVTNAIVRTLVAADDLGGIDEFAKFINVSPTQISGELAYFPDLPQGLNCSRFQLPVVGTVLPMHLLTGRGEAINVNFYGEAANRCN